MKTKIILLLMVIMTISLYSIQDKEKLTFNIRYGIVSAAEAELYTRHILYTDAYHKEPVKALKITSKANTYSFFDVFFKVRDSIISVSEKKTGLALYYEKNLREGGYKQRRLHNYDRENKKCIYQKWSYGKKEFSTEEVPITKDTYDFLGAFYHIRQQKLAVGDTLLMNLSGDGSTFATRIVVHKREIIKTIFGKKYCLKIEPQLAGETIFQNSGRIFIWVTDDEFKIPVQMESEVKFGSFVADLKDAENVGLRKE